MFRGVLQHRRGRVAGVSPAVRDDRTSRPRLPSIEEMIAANLCDCGQPLDTHPPLPLPKPLSAGRPCGREPEWSSGMSYGSRSQPLATPPRVTDVHTILPGVGGTCDTCGREIYAYGDSWRHRRRVRGYHRPPPASVSWASTGEAPPARSAAA
jgi:hypothetical protein